MSNIARQYIHVSYADVFNIFYSNYLYNKYILYNLLSWQTTPKSHRAHSASGPIQSRDTHQLLLQLPFQWCVCASLVRSFPCDLNLIWKHDRCGISISFFFFSPLPLLPKKLTKSDQPVRRHAARHTEDEEELPERLHRSNLATGTWPQRAASGGGKEPTLHILNQLRARLPNNKRREEHRSVCEGPACSPPSMQPFEPW